MVDDWVATQEDSLPCNYSSHEEEGERTKIYLSKLWSALVCFGSLFSLFQFTYIFLHQKFEGCLGIIKNLVCAFAKTYHFICLDYVEEIFQT